MCRNFFETFARSAQNAQNFHGLVTIFLYFIIEILKIFRFVAAYAAVFEQIHAFRAFYTQSKMPRSKNNLGILLFLLRRSKFTYRVDRMAHEKCDDGIWHNEVVRKSIDKLSIL